MEDRVVGRLTFLLLQYLSISFLKLMVALRVVLISRQLLPYVRNIHLQACEQC